MDDDQCEAEGTRFFMDQSFLWHIRALNSNKPEVVFMLYYLYLYLIRASTTAEINVTSTMANVIRWKETP